MTKPAIVDQTNFQQLVLDSKHPTLVDFWAVWCAPCLAVAPTIEELAQEYEGKINFAKVNVDGNSRLATKYGIMSIPTLLVFKDSKPIKQIVGLKSKSELKKILDNTLSEG